MFSKKSDARPLAPAARTERPMATRNSSSTFSVIGTDIAIRGNIEASADLHIDGSVEGDIACSALVQGEGSTITGAVTAETARLAGTVNGSISARELVILKSARIDGDVHYDALTIEQGAQVEGRFAPRATGKAVPAGTEHHDATNSDEPKLAIAQ